MTFHDVFGKLAAIDRAAVSLLEETGFHSDEGLGGTVRPLREPCARRGNQRKISFCVT